MTGPGDGHNGQKMVDAQKSQDTAAGDLKDVVYLWSGFLGVGD